MPETSFMACLIYKEKMVEHSCLFGQLQNYAKDIYIFLVLSNIHVPLFFLLYSTLVTLLNQA